MNHQQRIVAGRVLMVAALLTIVAHSVMGAGPQLKIVYPTGVFPTDHENVQAALAGGGKVLLKARDQAGTPTAFNFGPATRDGRFVFTDDTVTSVDVEILGELWRGRRTTIRGGSNPIQLYANNRTTVRNIFFDGPRSAAVLVTNSTGLDISNNQIANVVGAPLSLLPAGATKGQGIRLSHFIQPGVCLPCPAEDAARS